jgi:hypothetical protein
VNTGGRRKPVTFFFMNERFVRTIEKQDVEFAILIRERCRFRFCGHMRHRDQNLSFDELSDYFFFVEIPLTEVKASKPAQFDCKIPQLPKLFRLYLLPFLANASPHQIGQYLHYFWAFGLEDNKGLLAGISRLASELNHEKTLSWCNVLQYQQPNRRSLFITILVKSGVFNSISGNEHFPLWQTMTCISGRKNYPLRLWVLMDAVKRKIKTDSIMAGLQLVPDSHVMHDIYRCDDPPIDKIRSLGAHVRKAKEYYPSFIYEMWQACGALKGFAAVLRSLKDHKQLSPDVCLDFFDIFCDLATRDPGQVKASLWEYVRRGAPLIWKNLLTIPQDRRTKFMANVVSLIDYRLSRRIKHLEEVLILLNHLCADPRFLKLDESFAYMTAGILASSRRYKKALIFAPANSWFKLDQESEQNFQIVVGFKRMLKIIPLFSCKAFHFFPQKLFQVANRFGILPEGMDRKILSEFSRHPIFKERFGKKTDAQIVECFRNMKEFTNPVPKKFQQYAGSLSSTRRKRYRKIFYQNLHLTRLEILDQCIKAHLNQWPGVVNENILHSVLMLSGEGYNNRASKRFLKAYLAGRKDYILQHSRTSEWIRKHESLDLSLWMKGISLQFETETFGTIRMEVEQDPLEAWKLGTYVQSCLAVGGSNHQYAAAAVLDINKRVMYARNDNGKVVARQLLAISEEGTLVCFYVYPLKIATEIKSIFRKYDQRFAKALNIPIHHSKERYTIATIISRAWYDDSAWNLGK